MLIPKVEVPAPEDTVVGVEYLPLPLEGEQLGQVQHGVDLLQVPHPVLHVLLPHRRRINTEEKAKVVAVVCWSDFNQFLAMIAILHMNDFEE